MAQTMVSQVGPPLLARPEGLAGEIPEIIDNANQLLASAVTVLNWQAGEAVADYPDPASSELPVKSLQLQVQAAGRALAAYRGQVAALSEKISAVQSGGRLSALQVGDAQAPLATHLVTIVATATAEIEGAVTAANVVLSSPGTSLGREQVLPAVTKVVDAINHGVQQASDAMGQLATAITQQAPKKTEPEVPPPQHSEDSNINQQHGNRSQPRRACAHDADDDDDNDAEKSRSHGDSHGEHSESPPEAHGGGEHHDDDDAGGHHDHDGDHEDHDHGGDHEDHDHGLDPKDLLEFLEKKREAEYDWAEKQHDWAESKEADEKLDAREHDLDEREKKLKKGDDKDDDDKCKGGDKKEGDKDAGGKEPAPGKGAPPDQPGQSGDNDLSKVVTLPDGRQYRLEHLTAAQLAALNAELDAASPDADPYQCTGMHSALDPEHRLPKPAPGTLGVLHTGVIAVTVDGHQHLVIVGPNGDDGKPSLFMVQDHKLVELDPAQVQDFYEPAPDVAAPQPGPPPKDAPPPETAPSSRTVAEVGAMPTPWQFRTPWQQLRHSAVA